MTLGEAEIRGLVECLDKEPQYRILRVAELATARALSDATRYDIGDLIRVPRTGGHWSLGVVAERKGGVLRILLRSKPGGSVKFKELSGDRVRETNPLKIGDVLDFQGARFWILGVDEDGDLSVVDDGGTPVDPVELKARLDEHFRGSFHDEDTAATLTITPTAIQRIRQREGLETPVPRAAGSHLYRPLESIAVANTMVGLVAGNRETETVFGVRSKILEAALHTDRGKNYKSFNEDGAALFADKRGRIYVGVFDQAGGEGADAAEPGAASRAAAKCFFERMQPVARMDGGEPELETGLVEAVADAHQRILKRGRGEVSTFVGARIDRDRAFILNVGDSGVVHFDADGSVLTRTEPQGLGRLLLEGVGMLRDGARLPRHDLYRWSLSPGQYVVFGSDGLFDSRLELGHIGRLIAQAGDPKTATRELRDLITARMATRASKPDNLTIVIVQARRA